MACNTSVMTEHVAKRPAKKSRTEDRHNPESMLIRIPADHGRMLRRLKTVEDRPIAMIIARALRAYYQANGYQFPLQEDGAAD